MSDYLYLCVSTAAEPPPSPLPPCNVYICLDLCIVIIFLGQVIRRASLSPPDEKKITWEEYINAEPGEYPTLGRDLVYKETSKTFRATVAMVNIHLFIYIA